MKRTHWQRLYVHKALKGLIVLLTASIVTRLRADNVPAGSDMFITPAGSTFVDLGDPDADPIPGGFFGPGSTAFAGVITLKGAPVVCSVPCAGVDTIVERLDTAVLGLGGSDTVPVLIRALHLVSTSPITVTFSVGPPSTYDVEVFLSEVCPQGIGSMTLNHEFPDGGSFTSTLPVTAKMIFTKAGGINGVSTATLDPPDCSRTDTFEVPGASGGPPGSWSHVTPAGMTINPVPAGDADHDGDGFIVESGSSDFPASTNNFHVGICPELTGGGVAGGGGDEVCGACPPGPHFVDACPPGIDNLQTAAVVDIDMDRDGDIDTTMILYGPAQIQRQPGMPHEIETEIVSMQLVGDGAILRAGSGFGLPSPGQIVEVPSNPSLADSSFQVFFELDTGDDVLRNKKPLQVQARISCIPPQASFRYEGPPITVFNNAGMPAANVVKVRHVTPPPDCDPDAKLTPEEARWAEHGVVEPNTPPPPPNDGACCDHALPGGVCVDGTPPSGCVGGQKQFFKDEICADIEAAGLCGEHTGACCIEGVCTNDVPQSMCASVKWYKDTPCSDPFVSAECARQLPTLSTWGLTVLTALILGGIALKFARRRATAA